MSDSDCRYDFGPFRLDVPERRLLRAGLPVPLTPKAFDLLHLLVCNGGHLLTKDELIRGLWPDSAVEENNLTVNMSALRMALGDSKGAGGRYIETVPKVGYRFVAEVIERREGSRHPVPPSPNLGEEDGVIKSLAVLPLVNESRRPRLDYLCDGITESVISSLSQLHGLREWCVRLCSNRRSPLSPLPNGEPKIPSALRIAHPSPEYVLFDSWYTAATLLHLLEGLGWKYVARLKSNRLFEGEPVCERWPHRYGRAIGRVRKVSHQVVVVKDGRRYFVSNDTQLSSGALKRHYRLRQQIEEVFRLLKQEFGWGGASAQKARAQVAHLHLRLYALCLTQEATMQKWQTIYAFKRELFRLPIPEHLSQLENLSLAA